VDSNGFAGLLDDDEELYMSVDDCISSVGLYCPKTVRLLQGIGFPFPIMVGTHAMNNLYQKLSERFLCSAFTSNM